MGTTVTCFGSAFYVIGSALRRHTDLDVHLYLDDRTFALNTALRDERALWESEWIHLEPLLDRRSLAHPRRAALTNRLRSGDVVLASELGPVFAQFTGRPTAFLPVGGDVTVTPFPWRGRGQRSGARAHASASAIAYWQRRGIRAADEIWVTPFQPYARALQRLGVAGRRSRDYFPIGVDAELFREDEHTLAGARAAFPDISTAGDFVVFHPSRLMVDPHPFLVDTGQWKRNEVVLQGFAQFAEDVAGDPILLLVDQEYSPGRRQAEALAAHLGIADRVRWARAEGHVGFSWRQMRDLYLLSDVVLDDFGAGWFGMVVLEGASSSRPVITHVDHTVMDELYPWNPLIEANTPETVAAELIALHRDPERRRAIGREGRRWVEAFHGSEAIAAAYAQGVERLATTR